METQELKHRAGIRPYERRLRLQRVGGGFKAKCRWHHDHDPSLSIFEKDGEYFFNCFACTSGDVKGDVIDFVMKFDNVDFKAALATIKEECGIADDSKKPDFVEFKYDQKAATAQLARAEEFLKARGIKPELARECGVGYCEHPVIGPAVGLPYAGSEEVVKFRAISPTDKDRKFRHLSHKPSADLLFGMDTFDDPGFWLTPEVWMTESELDSLLMRSQGFSAVSISSATACLDSSGKLKFKKELLDKLETADRIFLAMDQDEAGQKCAAAFEKALPSDKTFRVTWKYAGKGGSDPKDLGELYRQSPDRFRERIEQLRAEALTRPPAWRELFKARNQMEAGDIRFLIKDFLPEGVCMIGALSGSGKTWFCLSMAKALTTGQRFLGRFEVPQPANVIYLIPESGERAFRSRLDKMGISERFLCRTMKDGVPLKLDDPLLLASLRELKPVVFLDTAIRFATGEENNASDNARGLATGIFHLLHNGAQAVIGLHHSAKSSANKEVSLENTLRGSGDIAAMADTVYHLKCVNPETLELRVTCTKPRDFEPVPPFHIQGRPFISEDGDFGMLLSPGLPKGQAEAESLVEAIKANPRANYQELHDKTGIATGRVAKVAATVGLKKQGGLWVADPKTLA